VVQQEVVATTLVVEQANAVLDLAIVVPVQSIVTMVVVVLLAILVTAPVVELDVQQDHAVRLMDFVEILLLTVVQQSEGLVMATVERMVAVLVFVVHDMDIVVIRLLIVLLLDSCLEKNQLLLKVNFKDKQLIIMKLWPVRIIAHVVQFEADH
jgi:hypothetical protein